MRILSASSFSTSLSRALQIGLNHSADAVLISRHAMQFVNEVQRALRVGRTFHIDAHKTGGFMDAAFFTRPATNSRAIFSSTSRPMCVSFRLMLAFSWLAAMASRIWW